MKKEYVCILVIEEMADTPEAAAFQFVEDVTDLVEQDAVMVVSVVDVSEKVRTIVYTSSPAEIVEATNYWPEP